MDPMSINPTFFDFDSSNLLMLFFKFAVAFFIAGYAFFSFFLYLRVRILSLTLTTPNALGVRSFALLHLFSVLGLAIFLGLLLLF